MIEIAPSILSADFAHLADAAPRIQRNACALCGEQAGSSLPSPLLAPVMTMTFPAMLLLMRIQPSITLYWNTSLAIAMAFTALGHPA